MVWLLAHLKELMNHVSCLGSYYYEGKVVLKIRLLIWLVYL